MRATHAALVVIIAVLVTALALVGVSGASTPACSACHTPQVTAWAQAGHASVACQFCHQRPGALGVVEQRTRMLIMLRSQVASKSPEAAVVSDELCLACHLSVTVGTIEANGIRMRHSDVIEQGRACVDCHSAVAHPSAVRAPRQALMEECVECHDGARASDDCEVCHVSDQRSDRVGIATPWSVTHGTTWRYTHGMGDQSSCRSCHPQGYCAKCHGIDLPHDRTWGNTHGRVARSVPSSCADCHEQDLCSDCHSAEMPHPKDFLPSHSAEVLSDGAEQCVTCHLQATCDACHEAHVHPGLTPEQIDVLGEIGGP